MPDTPEEKVEIAAITWNMGNKPASKAVVQEFKNQLGNPTPSVIAISTQEELAPNGKRLQDKMLKELNKGLPKDQQYVLVKTKKPQYHTTMAGANNSTKTLFKALFTDDNRVSSAILVKKPLKMENPTAEIEYEPGKKKGNKSVITISGTLSTPNGSQIPLSISGGHWDSNSDKKRRDHSDKFLSSQGMKTGSDKSFQDIFEEASTLRMVMGDFNERDYLMKDGKTKDKGHLTNYQSYGYDMSSTPEQKVGNKQIHGTYGFKFKDNDVNKDQDISAPDPRSRANVAKGGFLDKIAYATGLKVNTKSYGANLDSNHFKPNKKGKWFYHGSDHIPVIRAIEVQPSNQSKERMVGDYLQRRLPDYTGEITDLKQLLEAKNLNELEQKVTSLQYHDSTLSAKDFLKQLAGVNQDDFASIQKGLEDKLDLKINLQQQIQDAKTQIEQAVKNKDQAFLERAFNQLTACNELRNSALTVMGTDPKVFTESDKAEFMKIADKLIDLSMQQVLRQINGVNNVSQQKLTQAQQEMSTFIKKHPEIDSFKQTFDRAHSVTPVQPQTTQQSNPQQAQQMLQVSLEALQEHARRIQERQTNQQTNTSTPSLEHTKQRVYATQFNPKSPTSEPVHRSPSQQVQPDAVQPTSVHLDTSSKKKSLK